MEKKVIATNISSRLKQVMFMHSTKATKASNMRDVPFKVNEYLLYEQKKENESKLFLILEITKHGEDKTEVIATNSNVMIEIFSDLINNLEDESITKVNFIINEGKSMNGRSYNLLEFWYE